jgi:hypothetical protein
VVVHPTSQNPDVGHPAVIKTLLRRALDEQYVAAAARPAMK